MWVYNRKMYGVNFTSMQHEELTVTKAILKNDDSSSVSEHNNIKERMNGKTKIRVEYEWSKWNKNSER